MSPLTQPQVLKARAIHRAKAVKFVRDLVMVSAKKKTILVSVMQQYGLKVHDARAIYAEAQEKK